MHSLLYNMQLHFFGLCGCLCMLWKIDQFVFFDARCSLRFNLFLNSVLDHRPQTERVQWNCLSQHVSRSVTSFSQKLLSGFLHEFSLNLIQSECRILWSTISVKENQFFMNGVTDLVKDGASEASLPIRLWLHFLWKESIMS